VLAFAEEVFFVLFLALSVITLEMFGNGVGGFLGGSYLSYMQDIFERIEQEYL